MLEACHSRGHLQGLKSLSTLLPHLSGGDPSFMDPSFMDLIHERTWQPGPAKTAILR